MRLLVLILKLTVAIGFVVWLANQPGSVRVVWHGYVIETSAAFLTLAVLAVIFLAMLVYKGWRFAKDGPRFWRLRQKIRQLQKGQHALTQGLAAIAGSDASEAGRQAVAARKLLGETTATRLLQAQAAQLAGDHDVARQLFLKLAAEQDSAVLGYRGLIMAALRERKWDEAERQAEKLRRLKPETPWLSLIQFELAARRQDWRDASAALAQAAALQLVDGKRAKRHQAAVLLAASEVEAKRANHERALQMAEQALRHAPNWVPAVLVLAERQLAADHRRAALRIIEKAWAVEPHPQLAAAYRVTTTDGKVLDEYKNIERLTRSNPEHAVSKQVVADAALAADLWGEARRNFVSLIASKHATQTVFRSMAKLERREAGDEQAAMQWLIQAGEALPDPRWLCTNCGGSHEHWQSLCGHCGSFNSLEWQIPGASRYDSRAGLIAGMLETMV